MDREPPLAAVDIESDAVRDAWERAGLADPPSWPADEPQYRLRLPASDAESGLDAVAAVLDAVESPERVFLQLTVGRRAEFGPRRRTLESLSGHDAVVADNQTAGTVPLTPATFEALATLYADIAYALVWNDTGDAVVELRGETLTFVVPAESVETLPLAPTLAERIERVN